MGALDSEIQRLHDVVSSLEKRVEKLEVRQSGDARPEGGVRMILMGPPGAGELSPASPGVPAASYRAVNARDEKKTR
jgi:hypothetical protein